MQHPPALKPLFLVKAAPRPVSAQERAHQLLRVTAQSWGVQALGMRAPVVAGAGVHACLRVAA